MRAKRPPLRATSPRPAESARGEAYPVQQAMMSRRRQRTDLAPVPLRDSLGLPVRRECILHTGEGNLLYGRGAIPVDVWSSGSRQRKTLNLRNALGGHVGGGAGPVSDRGLQAGCRFLQQPLLILLSDRPLVHQRATGGDARKIGGSSQDTGPLHQGRGTYAASCATAGSTDGQGPWIP